LAAPTRIPAVGFVANVANQRRAPVFPPTSSADFSQLSPFSLFFFTQHSVLPQSLTLKNHRKNHRFT
jgi:hypothetical protein